MANFTDKSRFVCWVFGLSAVVTSVLVSGWAANRENPAKSGHVELEKHSSEKVKPSSASKCASPKFPPRVPPYGSL